MKNQRTGLIAKKLGMTQLFTQNGMIPVTVLKVERNCVLAQKDGGHYKSLQIGYGTKRKIKKPQAGIAKKAGIDSFRYAKEFRVSDDYLLPVGTEVKVDHFSLGQLVDVSSVSVGKGFQGVMKKYSFGGLEASHGVSASHRSGGSTGQRQDPGKVFKGKKMPGHMGCKRVTTQNLKVLDLDLEKGLIVIKGCVPGHEDQILYITDAIKARYIRG